MDFIYKNRRVIVIILAALMIGLGVFQMITGLTINARIMRGVEYVVMFGALYLLLVLPKTYARRNQKDVTKVEEEILSHDIEVEAQEKED